MSTTAQPYRTFPATPIDDAHASEPGSKLLLTVVEAAQRLGIGRTLMYELLLSGEIDSIHVGRLHRVPVEALTEFVARRRAHGANGG